MKTDKRKIRRGKLLLRWVVCECNTLLDVALQAFHAGLEEGLFVLVEVAEWVQGLLGSAGLFACQCSSSIGNGVLTPSSTGTEKKSQPVSLAMASPPGTPGR